VRPTGRLRPLLKIGHVDSESQRGEEVIQSHMSVLTGIDFFTAEVLTWRGLATYYVFLHLETRRVTLAGITQHPTEDWMV
jgi:hypothetical protein